MRRMLFFLCRRLARHTIPVPTRPTHQRKQMPKLPLWRNPEPSSALMLVPFSHNFRRQKLESQFAASACAGASANADGRNRSGQQARAKQETRRQSRRTRLPSPSRLRCSARQRGHTSPCASRAPRRTGRRGAMTKTKADRRLMRRR